MKVVSLSIMAILLSSYVYGFINNDTQQPEAGVSYQVIEDIEINIARSYDPDEFEIFEHILPYGSFFEIPDSIEVVAGSSGSGWLSLIVGERKFCYQGNRYNSEDTFGDEYIYVGELVNISDECYFKVFELIALDEDEV